MWTRGLDRGDTKVERRLSLGRRRGHVLFSNGKVEWYDSTQSDEQPEGVFKKYHDDRPGEEAYTSDIGEAIPDDWVVLKPGG